jgi:RNA polymerase sigma-54 factor
MIKQSLQQKLLQKLSPQQIQLMKLIQLPTLELEQAIKNELEVNPALEEGEEKEESAWEDDNHDAELHKEETEFIEAEDLNIDAYLSDDETPSYKLRSNNYADAEDDKEIPFAMAHSFYEHLKDQLHLLSLPKDKEQIANYLVGCINGNGYLRRELEDVSDDLAFNRNLIVSTEELEELLKEIQQLDPPGVGARDLQECLLIQLKRLKRTPYTLLSIEIIENHFESFTKKHFKKIIAKLEVTEDNLKEAMSIISKLNPKPGNSHESTGLKNRQQIVPDFEIRIVEGELELVLNGRNVPELKVNKNYIQLIKDYKDSKKNKDAALFAKQKLDSAKWFIEAIKQRSQTLYMTMSTVVEIQREYFLTGDETKLKPMILKDVADRIEMDISTISRVANSKYIQTPYGTKLIKEFFSESMKNTDGEDVSTREIKKVLQEVIDLEDKKKPLTDDKLAKALKEKGYPIARRTIAKYREQLNIPVARMRKKI